MGFLGVLSNGFSKGINHFRRVQSHESGEQNNYDDIDGLLHDIFRNVANGFNINEGATNGLNEEPENFIDWSKMESKNSIQDVQIFLSFHSSFICIFSNALMV